MLEILLTSSLFVSTTGEDISDFVSRLSTGSSVPTSCSAVGGGAGDDGRFSGCTEDGELGSDGSLLPF